MHFNITFLNIPCKDNKIVIRYKHMYPNLHNSDIFFSILNTPVVLYTNSNKHLISSTRTGLLRLIFRFIGLWIKKLALSRKSWKYLKIQWPKLIVSLFIFSWTTTSVRLKNKFIFKKDKKVQNDDCKLKQSSKEYVSYIEQVVWYCS